MSWLRLTMKAVANKPQASSTPAPDTSTAAAILQWERDEFNAQRADQDRRFHELLDECGAVHHARQLRFLALLNTVRASFNAAQEKSQESWKAMQKDLRDLAIHLQGSSYTRSEAARDSAANEGLASCERHAQHQFTVLATAYTSAKALLSQWNDDDITLLQRRLILQGLQQSPPIALFLGLERELRLIMDKISQSYLTQAPVSSYTLSTTLEHLTTPSAAKAFENFARRDDKEGYDNSGSMSPFTFPPPSEEVAEILAAQAAAGGPISPTVHLQTASFDDWPSTPYHGRPSTSFYYESLHAVEPDLDAKPASPLEGEFRRAQAIHDERWERHIEECYDASGSREKAFSDLQAELAAESLQHPSLKGGFEDVVTMATTAAFDFQIAEARRDMVFRRLWKGRIQSLDG